MFSHTRARNLGISSPPGSVMPSEWIDIDPSPFQNRTGNRIWHRNFENIRGKVVTTTERLSKKSCLRGTEYGVVQVLGTKISGLLVPRWRPTYVILMNKI